RAREGSKGTSESRTVARTGPRQKARCKRRLAVSVPRSRSLPDRKLIRWWVLVFLSIGWIVFYINTITKDSAAVLSPPLVLWSGLSAVTFLLLLVLFWRHNQFTHKRRYSRWERSFLCQRCGTLTEQDRLSTKVV